MKRLGVVAFGVLEAVRRSCLLLTTLALKPSQTGAGHTWKRVCFSVTIGRTWRQRDSFSDGRALEWTRAVWKVFGTIQLIQIHAIALSIVSDMVHKRWVGIFIVGDLDMGSALDARGDGGDGRKFLVALERLAMWTLCCCVP